MINCDALIQFAESSVGQIPENGGQDESARDRARREAAAPGIHVSTSIRNGTRRLAATCYLR